MSTPDQAFDPETLAVLKSVFDEACGLLPLHKRTDEMRSRIAYRILKLAAIGERNRMKLRTYALREVLSSTTAPQSQASSTRSA
jgi:hypothetical protein